MKKVIYLLQKVGDRTFWHLTGVAFVNKDGSITLKIWFLPGLTLQVRDLPKKES